MDAATAAHATDPITGYAAIVGSPVACLLLLVIAIIYFVRRDAARDAECKSEREAAAKEAKEFRIAAALEIKAERDAQRIYMETQSAQVVRALTESTEAIKMNVAAQNNNAACMERNTQATVRLTDVYRKTPLHDA